MYHADLAVELRACCEISQTSDVLGCLPHWCSAVDASPNERLVSNRALLFLCKILQADPVMLADERPHLQPPEVFVRHLEVRLKLVCKDLVVVHQAGADGVVEGEAAIDALLGVHLDLRLELEQPRAALARLPVQCMLLALRVEVLRLVQQPRLVVDLCGPHNASLEEALFVELPRLLGDGIRRTHRRPDAEQVALQQLRVRAPAVGEEEVSGLRVLVDELDKLPKGALAPEVEDSQVSQVRVAALDGLHKRALVLAHRRQQRHLLSGAGLVVEQHGRQARAAAAVGGGRNLRPADACALRQLVQQQVQHLLVPQLGGGLHFGGGPVQEDAVGGQTHEVGHAQRQQVLVRGEQPRHQRPRGELLILRV
mmetsp:Transcript_3577/g.7422  ORF Transcript_3577/g.7422 Transcript_3577/m.7422 type:complete len:368 (-) Transcript_3577:1569-2672(-)